MQGDPLSRRLSKLDHLLLQGGSLGLEEGFWALCLGVRELTPTSTYFPYLLNTRHGVYASELNTCLCVSHKIGHGRMLTPCGSGDNYSHSQNTCKSMLYDYPSREPLPKGPLDVR